MHDQLKNVSGKNLSFAKKVPAGGIPPEQRATVDDMVAELKMMRLEGRFSEESMDPDNIKKAGGLDEDSLKGLMLFKMILDHPQGRAKLDGMFEN